MTQNIAGIANKEVAPNLNVKHLIIGKRSIIPILINFFTVIFHK
jgi:hypothetical protein